MGYVFGFIGIIVGTLMILKTEVIVSAFGRSSWAEQHMGTSGGTRLMYKLIGIAMILISLLGMSGELGNIILAILGPLFGIR